MCMSLASPQEHGLDRLDDDEQIELHRHVLDVEQVVLQLLHRVLEAGAVGVAHLRPPGEPGFDDMALAVERDLLAERLHELGAFGARSDQAHLADEDVPELRQLVEPCPRIKRPSLVTRMSLAPPAHTGPVSFSALAHIDRSLWTEKTRPSRPTRRCE